METRRKIVYDDDDDAMMPELLYLHFLTQHFLSDEHICKTALFRATNLVKNILLQLYTHTKGVKIIYFSCKF